MLRAYFSLDHSQEYGFGDMGGLIRQRTFRSLRCVIPGLAAGVAGWVADQVNGRRRPVFGPPDRVPVADDPIGTRR